MAGKYPYVAGGGPIEKAVAALRRSFPKEVTAETLTKLGVAPQNESRVINILRFIGVVDDEGRKIDSASKVFVQHDGTAFAAEFAKLVRAAYSELFDLHGDAAWTLDRDSLTQFFRTSDHSSDVVGTRQATTFSTLAGLAGHQSATAPKVNNGQARSARSTTPKQQKPTKSAAKPVVDAPVVEVAPRAAALGPVGLTVRVEVNLPASGDQETYDRIFQSIRKNLIDA